MALLLAELINPIILLLGGVWLFTKWKKTQKRWHFWLAVLSIILSFFNFYRVVISYNDGQEREKVKFEKTKMETLNFQKSLSEKFAATTPLSNDSLILFDNALQILVPAGFVMVEQSVDKINYLSLSLNRSYLVTIIRTISDDATLDDAAKQYEESILVKLPTAKFTTGTNLTMVSNECQVRDYSISDSSNKLLSHGSTVYIKKGKAFYTICYSSLIADNQTALTKLIHKSISLK